MALFSRLDQVDWASLSHAYGPAEDVPGLVRGLVSPLSEEREESLDGMLGAVHHQGDVYDSTVAVLPFLFEALAERTAPGRAEVLGLIGSIAASAAAIVRAGGGSAFVLPGAEAEAAEAARLRVGLATEALVVVRARQARLVEAISDGDATVRRMAPEAVISSGVEGVEAALRTQFAKETDAEARRHQAQALAAVLAKDSARAGELEAWLTSLSTDDADPALRLDALARLLERPVAPSPALVEQAQRTVWALYGHATPSMATPSAGTDTLTGTLRAVQASEARGRRAPDAGQGVHDVSNALGDRVEARVRLLGGLLGSDDWEMQLDALGPLAVLMGRWRGDYREVIARLGDLLLHGRGRIQPRVAAMLQDLFQLAAPATDALAEAVSKAAREGPPADEGLPPWIVRWPGDDRRTCGETLVALARAGDARAVPAFEWMLREPELPRDVGFALAPLKGEVAGLAALLAQRLAEALDVDPTGRHPAVAGLIFALAELGPKGLPGLDALLALAPYDEFAIRAIGKLGPGAAKAVPALTRLLDHSEPGTAIAAATALSLVAPGTVPVAPVFARHLAQWGAAAGLSRLGAAALPYVRNVQALVEHRPVEAAAALWRMTGTLDLAPLERSWRDEPFQRAELATLLEEIGPPAAALAGELQAELARARRHNARDHGASSHQVDDDEKLLGACRRALARLTTAR